MAFLDGRSIEGFFSAFTYKPHDTRSPPLSPTPTTLPPNASSLTRASRGRGRRGGGGNNERNPSHVRGDCEPNTPPPHLSNKRRKRTPPFLTSIPSSSTSPFIRITIDGKPRVVTRYFPLPPRAVLAPVLTDGENHRPSKSRVGGRSLRSRRGKGEIDGSKRNRNCSDEDPNDNCEQLKKRRKRRQSSVQLSASEKKSDAYRRILGNNTWEPPASYHRLLQERHSFDPWRVLVICILLNITSGTQVRKVLPGLFLLCPDAETTTKVPEEEIEKVIQTLGLQKKRARMIKRFSCEYLRSDWTHVTQLHGIGKYAADAYAIFCAGKAEQVVPQDHKLVDYWKFVCGKEGDTE